MRRVLCAFCSAVGVAIVALAVSGRAASAHVFECDFLTGGGWILTTASRTHAEAKANFAIGGGCQHGSPTWGHLEYQDHGRIVDGNHLNVHWTSITAYMMEREDPPPDPKTHQPLGARLICGTARSNHFGDVDFVVRAEDEGEPGVNDEFDIRLSRGGTIVYTTEFDGALPHKLGGGAGGGGNIQLHKPNPSTNGEFGGSCPALSATMP